MDIDAVVKGTFSPRKLILFTVRAAFDEVASKKATHVWVKPYHGGKDTEGLHQFLFFLKPEATGVHEGVKLREGMIFDVSPRLILSQSLGVGHKDSRFCWC